ncbi:MAG: hypothetical protein ACXADF_15895 [Candidatus Thorarchaeota archaeon]
MSSFKGSIRIVLYALTGISLIALAILVLLTTDPLGDSLFFIDQIRIDSILIDLNVILFGAIGFAYYFILPGLPLLIRSGGRWLSWDHKDILVATMYSGIGNYGVLLLAMAVGLPSLGVPAPLFLFVAALGVRILMDRHGYLRLAIEPMPFKWPQFRTYSSYAMIAGVILVVFSLIIRFSIFNSNVVEFSDVLVYHQQIISISFNDYLMNPNFTARAPLYTMFSYQFSYFTPTPLASLKAISFMYSLLLFVPAFSIMQTLSKNRNSVFIRIGFPVLFAIYPWNMMMASVALQDILLTFYVMSFVALILISEQKTVIAAGIAAGLSFLCRYSLGILGPLGFLYLAVRDRRTRVGTTFAYGFLWSAIAGTWIFRNLAVAGVPFSTTDEGLFSLSNFVPGIINIVKEFGMDRHGMNSATLWFTIIIGVLYLFRKNQDRSKIRAFFSLDYIFIYIILFGQIITLSFFFSQQYRFMLSIIWFFPVLWILLMDTFDMPGKHLMLSGWIFFSITHSMNIVRNYWVFYLGRLPVGSSSGPFIVVPAIMPTLANFIAVLMSLSIVLIFTVLSRIALMPLIKNTSERIDSDKDQIVTVENRAEEYMS